MRTADRKLQPSGCIPRASVKFLDQKETVKNISYFPRLMFFFTMEAPLQRLWQITLEVPMRIANTVFTNDSPGPQLVTLFSTNWLRRGHRARR